MPADRQGFSGGAPPLRVRAANDRPVRPDGAFVLYWMIASRRPAHNFALDRAVAWSVELGLPLVVLEALRAGYPYASDRLHRFAIDGMAANARAFSTAPVRYYPYVEPHAGAGKGLLARLAGDAAVVITDEYPCFFLPHAVAAAASRVTVRLEAIDSNGLIPLAAAPRAYTAAAHFRRFVQGVLRTHLVDSPSPRPFARGPRASIAELDADVVQRWPPAAAELLEGSPAALARLPIDHQVPAVTQRGGFEAARRALRSFVKNRLTAYGNAHNHPDDRGTSRLSPYLHFGHVSAHEVFEAVMRHERWSLGRTGARSTGAREGWWGVHAGAEAFLDQLVVWRELAFNACHRLPDDYFRYDSLPPWARATLAAHARDPRPFLYDHGQFERAETHDPLWNAAQREMLRDGRMHNYMRMLWGKKILEWSATPREALETMTLLMNRWSLDGRDPNSYAGYMWILGRYDRPWPERAVFGMVRSMTSQSTLRKVRVTRYLKDATRPLFDSDR
jgi:deoxyribodipyrimidine photo-lyase